jgi:hypothetical protein
LADDPVLVDNPARIDVPALQEAVQPLQLVVEVDRDCSVDILVLFIAV